MALNTNIALRGKSIYQVFVRQHSKTQDFKGLINDLDRIKKMGFDIIYLLPFHPIGKLNRKGTIGSPYSISNYYEIDEKNGNLADFEKLALEIKKKGMLLMMDIVINHTSRDSKLLSKHPEWFYKDKNGQFNNRVGDWSDITDLDFSNKKLWDYLIEMLKYWAKYVDAFRCDVAPLVPLDFWKMARKEIAKIKPNFFWLAESVQPSFIRHIRNLSFEAASDSQIYEAFDICYDYDIYDYMDNFIKGEGSLSRWLEEIMDQEAIYPQNYIKARSFENHDQKRLFEKIGDIKKIIHMHALSFFLRGMPFIYAGGEFIAKREPSLFEDDLVEPNKQESIENLITKLNEISKDEIMIDGIFKLEKKDFAIFSYTKDNRYLLGIFDVEKKGEVEVNLKDGSYTNKINGDLILVKNGKITNLDYPIILDLKVEEIKVKA